MSDTPSLEYPKFNTNIKMTISKYSMNFLGNNYGVIHYVRHFLDHNKSTYVSIPIRI